MKELSISKRMIFTPGPVGIDPRVSKAMGYSILGQFDPDFTEIMNETMSLIRKSFLTTNQWSFPIDGTSRAGLEAVIGSIVEPGDKVLVPIIGRFGHLLVELCERAKAEVHTIECTWGEVFEQDKIIEAVKTVQPKVLAIVHGETSTGRMQPLDKIGPACQELGVFTVVDAVATYLGTAIPVDEWQLDAVIGGAQKCLSIPSGITPITFNDRFAEEINKRKRVEQGIRTSEDHTEKEFITSNYLDLTQLQDYWSDRRLNHHTEATVMVYALREGLRLAVEEEGVHERADRHQLHHDALKVGLRGLGLELFGDEENEMPMVACVKIPEGIDSEGIRANLLKEYGIEIASSFGPLQGKIWRIGTMGYIVEKVNIVTFITIFSAYLKNQGVTGLNPDQALSDLFAFYNQIG